MYHLNKIPKILHCYWGSHMLSYLRWFTLFSFRKYNPNWTIKFYYPKKIYEGGPVWNQGYASNVEGENYFKKISEIRNIMMVELDLDYMPDVFRSDMLRLQLLGEEGGFWSDMDIIYFKSLEESCLNTFCKKDVDTIISYNKLKRHYSIGFLGACTYNPFFKYLYTKSLNVVNKEGEYQHLGISLWDKYFKTPEDILIKFPQLNIINIEMWFTYFINSFEIDKMLDRCLPFSDNRTIGLHFYGGHPRLTWWESNITPNNLNQFNNTLVNTIKGVLNVGV
jgi:hypothetical protein